ncbi:hypothetical protein [Flavobacterium aquicola]|uniref:Uncharacterized protein n=1 Tax=Flavobacterium aquicola TaxID=1682742 RepID=A0A3E0DVX1_9FLAO|nr:hypothetical protein [Flavobacterium aquicola]REG90247.1 hypothetical protein C8P67_1277 [Flavobacterium aquicola]
MDKETAEYIVTYFFNLLPEKEKLAWRHHSSILKLEENENPKSWEMYKRKGWITDDKEVLDLLKVGYDNFEMNTAKKIIEEYPEKVFLNNCPECGKLARTPKAKQCRFCGFNWHK